MGFARFMSTTTGRLIRIVAGAVLVALGVALGGSWWALAVVGLVPIAAGVFNVCLLAPLLHAPFSGTAIRRGH
jgi:Protein of unknown function (DUF2892)